MDLREVAKLHAQYAAGPVIIDIAGQVAAIPALPAPVRDEGSAGSGAAAATFARRHAKAAGIVVAFAVLALGGGISAGKLWQVLHRPAGDPQVATMAAHGSAAPQSLAAPISAAAAAPISAAPARPLSASDFAVTTGKQPALANVDSRELAHQPPVPVHVPVTPMTAQPLNDEEARAIASPVHAQAAASDPVASQAAQPVAPVQPTIAIRQAARGNDVLDAATQPQSPAPSAPRHEHRAVAHRSAVSAAKSGDASQDVQDKPAAPAKASDVQLF